jgi:hypothetical protein
MQAHLKRQLVLQNLLLCDEEFIHVHCLAHVLNFIVQEGLKVVGDSLRKIRDNVSTWKVQRVEWNFFNECIELIGGVDTSAGLSFDVPRRWNSTYLMLENASRYRIVFSSLSIHDDNFKRPKIWFWNILSYFQFVFFANLKNSMCFDWKYERQSQCY